MKHILYILLLLPAFVHAQSIHIIASSDSVCAGSTVTFNATDTGVITPYFHWQINGINKGTDTSAFITDSLNNGDTVVCMLTNSAGDTILDTSNNIVMMVSTKPFVAPIFYTDSIVCVGATITLSDTTLGGIWTASDTNAKVSNGIVTGVSINTSSGEYQPPTTDTIWYSVSDSGCTISKSLVITIATIPNAYFFVGSPLSFSSLCVGGSQPVYSSYDYDEGSGDFFDGQIYSTKGYVSYFSDDLHGWQAGIDSIYGIETNICGSDTYGTKIEVYSNVANPYIVLPSTTICVEDSTKLTDTNNAFSNIWTVSNKSASINNNGVLKGVNPGIDTIILSIGNPCISASTTVTINVLPPKGIIGFDSFCIGGMAELKDSTTSGIWNSANTDLATIDQSGNINIIAAGYAIISYSFGSCTVSKQIEILPPLPQITGETNICRGAKVPFSESPDGGFWYSSDPLIVQVDTIKGVVTGKENGNAIITYQLSGCTTSTDITVKQDNDNITGASFMCTNSETTLSADGNGAWSTTNTSIASIDPYSGKVTGINVGYAAISYTLNTGCFDTAAISIVNCGTQPYIFPNPSNYEVTIQADTSLYFACSFINCIGQTVFSQPINANLTTVNIHLLPAGIYFVTLYGYNGKDVLKLLKE